MIVIRENDIHFQLVTSVLDNRAAVLMHNYESCAVMYEDFPVYIIQSIRESLSIFAAVGVRALWSNS